MSWSQIAEEVVGEAILVSPDRSLTKTEIDTLLRFFGSIARHWQFKIAPEQLEPIVRDLIASRSNAAQSYRPEYINAALLYQAMEADTGLDRDELIFHKTIIDKDAVATTRLQHMKRFVANEFISCFVSMGGFKEFGGRNHRGFMGGSRFGDTPPVRT